MARKRPDSLRSNPAKNRLYQAEWMRNYRLKPGVKERGSERTRAWQKRNPIQTMWILYTTRCRRQGKEFRISRELFNKLLVQNCFYCGIEANPVNTLDRIDSDHGYFVGNVVTACDQCNRAKRDTKLVEFEEWLMRIHSHYFKERSA